MALTEHAPEPEEEGPAPTPVAIALHADEHDLLVELMARTGFDASELVGWALGAYWREMEGIVLPPEPVEDLPHVEYPENDFRRYFTPHQVAAIEAGLADVAAGRVVDHEVVVAELREKYGW